MRYTFNIGVPKIKGAFHRGYRGYIGLDRV